jgi:hypothetical protein
MLKELLGKHKEKMARKTLKCIEMSLEIPKDGNGYQGRFRCAHGDNEYIAVEMPDLKYLKQILGVPVMVHGDGDSRNDPTDDSSRINDSIKHRLVDVLYMHPIPDVSQIFRDHSIGQIDEALYRYLDIFVSGRTERRDKATAFSNRCPTRMQY